MDFDDTLRSLDWLLFTKVVDGRTLCESTAYKNFPIHRKNYCGTREDLTQALVVGLLEWAKTQPNPEQLSLAGATKVVNEAVVKEVEANCYYDKEGGGGGLGQDAVQCLESGLTPNWNPEDLLVDVDPGRWAEIKSAVNALVELVGIQGVWVINARDVHGLDWDEIYEMGKVNRYRECSRKVPVMMGDMSNECSLKPEQLEKLYEVSKAKIRERYGRGDWRLLNKCLYPKRKPTEDEIRC